VITITREEVSLDYDSKTDDWSSALKAATASEIKNLKSISSQGVLTKGYNS
jgi:hypothetical protein